jgi:hypothetical protein
MPPHRGSGGLFLISVAGTAENRNKVAKRHDLGPVDADEAAKVIESRFVIAQLLASTGEIESAITELQAVRPLLAAAYGPESAQVRNFDKQAARLRSAPRT